MAKSKKTFDEIVAELDFQNKAKGMRKVVIFGIGKNDDISQILYDLANKYEQGEIKDDGKNIFLQIKD